MSKKLLIAIQILLCILPALFAENTMFYLRWTNTVADNTTIKFTDYSDANNSIVTKALEITSESQPAFAAVYSTNRLGNHNIRFSSTRLTNGEVSIPYSIKFTKDGEDFSSLIVGTTEQQYISSTGTVTVRRPDLSDTGSCTSTIKADLTLGRNDMSVDDYPEGDYAVTIQFIVEVQ